MEAGQLFGLQPGHTSTIRRIEGGMLSYHADADMHTNPFELGMDRLVNLNMEADFIGKEALKIINREGVSRKQVGLIIETRPLVGPNTSFWLVRIGDEVVGKVTSAVYSPRLERNIAMAMVSVEHTAIGTKVEAETEFGTVRASVVGMPFYDPNKAVAKAN
jgi:aminomethyltransferase